MAKSWPSDIALFAALGAGGMGDVDQAVDLELGELIALKAVGGSGGRDFATDSALVQELQLARRISHNNVCRLYHIDRHRRATGDVLFITMELLEGRHAGDAVGA